MITGIDLNETVEYTLKDDKDNPTKWKLGVIPSLVFMSLAQNTKGNEIESAYKVLQIGLKGWENFGDIEYKTEQKDMYGRKVDLVPMDIIERIPVQAIMELSMKLMEINKLEEKEEKN